MSEDNLTIDLGSQNGDIRSFENISDVEEFFKTELSIWGWLATDRIREPENSGSQLNYLYLYHFQNPWDFYKKLDTSGDNLLNVSREFAKTGLPLSTGTLGEVVLGHYQKGQIA